MPLEKRRTAGGADDIFFPGLIYRLKGTEVLFGACRPGARPTMGLRRALPLEDPARVVLEVVELRDLQFKAAEPAQPV
jgi:hypothetical protein